MFETTIPSSDELLGAALIAEISQYYREKIIPIGVYGGYDPAEVNDASALVVLSKDPPSELDKDPYLKVRTLKDVSLNENGIKGVTYLQQAKNLVELDKRLKFTKLSIDITRDKIVLQYLREYMGARVEGVVFSRKTKQEMITAVKVVFQEKIIQLNPNSSNFKKLRKELYELDPRTLKHPDQGSDDFAWALALGVYSTSIVTGTNQVVSGECDDEIFFF